DITTFPQGSTTTAAPAPVSFDHTCAPAGDSFTRKPARAEAVNGPPPKSIVPEKSPVTTTLPAGSVATPIPLSYPDPPPVTLDQRCAPAGEYLVTKMPYAGPPALSAPPPKSTVP